MHLLPPFIRKYGMIPESYKLAMTYEEQLLWLCKFIEDLSDQFDEFKTVVTNLSTLVSQLETRVNQNVEDILNLQARVGNLENKFPFSLLDTDIHLENGSTTTGLTKGYYYTGNCKVYIGTELPNTPVIGEKSYFYFDPAGGVGFAPIFRVLNDTLSILSPISYVYYDSINDEWTYTTGGSGGTSDYEDLSNKPSIGGVTLEGNKTLSELGLVEPIIPLTENVTILGETVPLTEGYYKTEDNVYVYGTVPQVQSIYEDYYVDLSGNVGDTINRVALQFDDTAYKEVSDYISGQSFSAKGRFTAVVIDSNNVILDKIEVASSYNNYHNVSFVGSSGTLIVSWIDTPTYTPELRKNVTGTLVDDKTMFYYNASGIQPYIKVLNTMADDPNYLYDIIAFDSTFGFWETITFKITSVLNSSSTGYDIPTSKAVYNLNQYDVKGNGNTSSVVTTIWTGTQTEYDNLGSYSTSTLYFIEE